MSNLEPPNCTQLPNVLFDYWMSVLKTSEYKVLTCICWNVFGWKLTADLISKNQLIEDTGLSKKTVQSAIETLEGHGLLIEKSSGFFSLDQKTLHKKTAAR